MAILRISIDAKTGKKLNEVLLPGPTPDKAKFIEEFASELARKYEEECKQ